MPEVAAGVVVPLDPGTAFAVSQISVGMTMAKGPWFFASFGGGWRFKPTEDGGTEAIWKYTYAIKPSWLRWIAEPIGQWPLGREIRARINAYATACADPVVLAAVETPRPPEPDARVHQAGGSFADSARWISAISTSGIGPSAPRRG